MYILDKVKNTANITLLVLMLLGIYQHWMVSDPFERSGPALVFTFMLGGRLVVWYQVIFIKKYISIAFTFYIKSFQLNLKQYMKLYL